MCGNSGPPFWQYPVAVFDDDRVKEGVIYKKRHRVERGEYFTHGGLR